MCDRKESDVYIRSLLSMSFSLLIWIHNLDFRPDTLLCKYNYMCIISPSQNCAKITKIARPWQKSTQFCIWSDYIRLTIFAGYPAIRSSVNARKPQVGPFLLGQNYIKFGKIRPWLKANKFWRWPDNSIRLIVNENLKMRPVFVSQNCATIRESTCRDQNVITTDYGQDVFVAQTWSHSFHAFLR